ncbi:hypothetical protein SDC9_143467 [bioreactor metagenome]|uniref:Uncharacterized protein n=1 Tax=bioreactor metagenome TaxID=1076179 RepID=A0A645E445_9ZZZZ
MRAPHTHQPRKLFALQRGIQARARQLRGSVLRYRQFTCLLQLVEVADGGHAPCEFRAQLGGVVHLLGRFKRLLGRHRTQPSAARVCRNDQHVLRCLQRGAFHLPTQPARAPGQGDDVDQTEADLPLNLALMAVDEAAQRQRGIEQRQRLRALRIVHGKTGKLRLQIGVVQERNAHGGVLIDWLFLQPLGHALLRICMVFGIVGRQRRIRRQAGLHLLLHVAAQAVGGNAGATGQQQGGSQHGQACGNNARAHGWAP